MKKIFAIIFPLTLVVINSSAQQTFIKTYGNIVLSGATGESVEQTTDGGFIAIGSANYGGYVKVFLVKTDNNGNILWTKAYGGTVADWGKCVKQTSDNGYIVAGRTSSFGAGNQDMLLIKTDSNGDTLWTKTYGGISNDYANTVIQTTDGGYIIGGYSYQQPVGGMCVIKTDSAGNVQWSKIIGNYGVGASSIAQTTDGGYIVSSEGMLLAKLSSIGNIQWIWQYKNVFPGDGCIPGAKVYSVDQTSDGGYIFCGNSVEITSPPAPNPRLVYVTIIKATGVGAVSWVKRIDVYTTMNNADQFIRYVINQTSDGGYIMAGSKWISTLNDDFCMIKMDNAGDFLWAKTFNGGGTIGVGHSLRQTTDGGYVIVGQEGDCIHGLCLIKTDGNGNVGCNQNDVTFNSISGCALFADVTDTTSASGCLVSSVSPAIISGGVATVMCTPIMTAIEEQVTDDSIFSISPNPATNELRIESATAIELVEIYNVLGRLTPAPFDYAQGDSQSERSPIAIGRRLLVDVSKLAPGIYFIKLRTAKEEHVAKFVKK